MQVGVVSWGYFPGVYSRVSGTKHWIDATIYELSGSHLERKLAIDTPG
jgi:secreted trypsin-like serine protease